MVGGWVRVLGRGGLGPGFGYLGGVRRPEVTPQRLTLGTCFFVTWRGHLGQRPATGNARKEGAELRRLSRGAKGGDQRPEIPASMVNRARYLGTLAKVRRLGYARQRLMCRNAGNRGFGINYLQSGTAIGDHKS